MDGIFLLNVKSLGNREHSYGCSEKLATESFRAASTEITLHSGLIGLGGTKLLSSRLAKTDDASRSIARSVLLQINREVVP
jgi:hypothetical protein